MDSNAADAPNSSVIAEGGASVSKVLSDKKVISPPIDGSGSSTPVKPVCVSTSSKSIVEPNREFGVLSNLLKLSKSAYVGSVNADTVESLRGLLNALDMLGLLAPRPTDVKSSKVAADKSYDVPNFEASLKKSPVLMGSAAGAGGLGGAGGGVGAGASGGGIIGA